MYSLEHRMDALLGDGYVTWREGPGPPTGQEASAASRLWGSVAGTRGKFANCDLRDCKCCWITLAIKLQYIPSNDPCPCVHCIMCDQTLNQASQ